MALDVSPEEKAVGTTNFQRTVGNLGMNRRQFMQGLLAGGAALPVAAAAYFGYGATLDRPVKAALIGAGDEGGVLVGEHNPAFLEFTAICDVRPSNFQERIWRGESRGPRKGLNFHYGNDAKSKIRHFTDYREMLTEMGDDIEAVVIALPLFLHEPCAVHCMQQGKHVLCEKLMAWNIRQCKNMIKVANDNNVVLSVGHQRHYSMLYTHANEIMQSGLLGDVHHIRAQWHRNNTRPLNSSDPRWNPSDPHARYRDSWRQAILDQDRSALSETDVRRLGYKNIEELVRWRLYQETGGGLMAELGSHQLDACSIFLGKVKPLAVTGTGGKYFYEDDREVYDHVFCTFEFPGKNYWRTPPTPQSPDGVKGDQNDVVVVTYSSINTNGFEPYGECVMGTKGTLVVEREQNAMLWGISGRSTAVTVRTAGLVDSSASEGGSDRTATQRGQAAIAAPPSRGYREEMEHFAYIIRTRNQGMAADRSQLKPRCDGPTAMADAIMALAANKALRGYQNNGQRTHRVEFDARWYDPAKMTAVPDSGTPRAIPYRS